VQIVAESDPSHRIGRLLDAARDLLHADSVTFSRSAREPEDGKARASTSRPARLSVPLHHADGEVVALSAARDARPEPFSEADRATLTLLAALIGGALREQALLEQARNAHHAFLESEQRLRDFAEASSDWFWEQDAELRCTWISQSVHTVLGLNPSDHYGKTARETHPLDIDESHWARHEADLLAQRPFRDFRFGRIDRNGRRRTVAVSGKPVFDAAGEFRGYRGVGADITPQVEAQAQAEAAHRALVDAIESLDDGFLLYDADDRLVLSNRRVLELVPAIADVIKPGVTFEDVVRAAASRGYYHEARGTVDEVVYGRVAQPLLPDGRIEMHVDSETVVQVKASRTRDGGRLILVSDVTELRRTTAALEVSERDYRMMVDGVDDVIYRIDPTGTFTYVNPQVTDLFGWTPDEVIGTHYLELIATADRASAARFYVRQFARRIPSTYYELPALAKDGSEVWIGQHVRLVEEHGQVVGALAVARDITARKEAEAREHARLQAQAERARTLNRLAQSISSSLDLETVLHEIARAASALLDAPVVRFWMVDEPGQTLWLAADTARGPGMEHGPGRVNLVDLRGVLGWVAQHRQPLMIPRAADDPRVRDAAWWAARGLTSFLGHPVLLDGKLLAVLILWGRQPFAFDADASALLDSFVFQAALSIRNAQLYLDTDQQRRRLQSLVEVSHRLSRGLDLTEVLDAITEAAATIFGGEAGVRLLVGDELVRASVSRGARQRPSMERITTTGGLIGEVLRTGRPAATSDVTSERRIATHYRDILQNDRLTALLIAPIRRDERVLGTLHIYRERGHEWRDDAHLLAAGLADQAAMAIENATRYAGLQESLERARIPTRVNQLLTAALDLDVLLREIAGAAVKLTGAVVASLWLAEEESRSLTLVVFSDESIGAGRAIRRVAFGEGWAGWVAEHRQVLAIDDVFQDSRTADLDWWRRNGLNSAYVMPVVDGDRLVAVLSIDGHEPIQIRGDSRDLLNGLVAQAAAALRNAALYREISATNRRLEQEVRRNELLLNSVADGVFGVDADGRITFVNPAALRLLGYALGDLLGQDAEARLHHTADDGAATPVSLCPFGEALRRGEAYRSSNDAFWRRDGQGVSVECVLTPMLQDGAPNGAVVTFRDIRREKEAERQRGALAQSEKLRALGQLAGGVAHDLNQSLGLVVGHSELALETIRQSAGPADDLRESIETIIQGALDGAQTVRRLQTFVRGQPEGAAERISIGALLADVARLTAPRWRDDAQAAGAPINVSVNVAVPDSDEILGWAPSLREALTNLVFNAVDAMPEGGTLQLRASGTSSHIVAEIADTGTGMPPEVAARVFEPFFTTKGDRGTGLGLAMVYGIVERHAGRIEVESQPGHGTTIRMLLPRAPGSASVTSGPGNRVNNRPRTILIVDDEEALRRMLARMLQIDGHTVVAAATADEALAQLDRQRFDLVMSDHGLGLGMNGLELATAVRDRWPGTRFILVTGWGGSIDPDEVRPLGVETVIGKPYRAPELRQHINALP
jgi:PAS domain S-box-containing protein